MKTSRSKYPVRILRFKWLKMLFVVSAVLFFGRVTGQEVKVQNVDYVVADSTIEISYTLQGDPSKKYVVDVELKRSSNAAFSIIPQAVTGDVGKGKFTGSNRKIIWKYLSDYHPDANASDYYFNITAEPVKRSKWYYWAGGAAIVAAVAILVLMSGGSDDPATSGLPLPPAHP